MEKKCRLCNLIKPVEEMSLEKRNLDGYSNVCRPCKKKLVSDNYKKKMLDPVFAEKERKRGRERYYRLGYKERFGHDVGEKKKEYMTLYRKNYPEKQKAVSIARQIKRREKLVGIELHHWSYNPEHYLDVIRIEVLKHRKAHIYIVYDQEHFMYRRIDTMELLDTREKHEAYIFDCIANKPD